MRLLSLVFCFLLLPVYLFASEPLFSEEITEEEMASLKADAESAVKVSKQLDALRHMIMYMAFQRGDCDDVIDIEQKAVRGDAESQYILGSLFKEGLCVPQNSSKAIEWTLMAANQDYLDAQRDLSIFYLQGDSADNSESMALPWLNKCSKAGDDTCLLLLAEMYLEGKGVLRNTTKAIGFYEQAAIKNNEKAIAELGFIYVNGEKAAQDFEKAERWWLRGAERGQGLNQYLLAVLLSDKQNGRYSQAEAYKWVNLASQSQNQKIAKVAIEKRNEFETNFSRESIVKGEGLSVSWEPKSDEVVTVKKERLPKTTSAGVVSKEQALAKLKVLNVPVTRETFFQSIAEDNFEIFNLFVKAGASVNTRKLNPSGVTPLYWAVDFGSYRIVDFLLKNGADINLINTDNGMTPLVRAIAHERWDIANRLLDLGASVEQPKETHPQFSSSLLPGTALGYAAGSDNPQILERILKAGASVDEVYVYWNTPLMQAAEFGLPENVKILIEHGADVNSKNNLGQTALLKVVTSDKPINYEMLETLLSAGASTASPQNEVTPLLHTVLKGDSGAIKLLSKYGSDVNEEYHLERNKIPMNISDEELADLFMYGGTPLMVAAKLSNLGAVKVLLDLGADTSHVAGHGEVYYTLKNNPSISSLSLVKKYKRTK